MHTKPAEVEKTTENGKEQLLLAIGVAIDTKAIELCEL